ncbi:hypothetical protein P7K49_031387 [Saguinus oedipus]|uniref:Uncharacterized protein n=1 Tax=Saguinus oedipus TaxID=9490 RepID=A0ABQ9TZC0_SAGOE|nr:hypothetical protein P7K49_031387 [Saguinus oedipus]
MQCLGSRSRSRSRELYLQEQSLKVAALNGQRLGLQDDKDLQALLKGSQLLKVKSSSWRRERFYKLQEDCKTIWQESRKVMRTPESQLCEYPGVTGEGAECGIWPGPGKCGGQSQIKTTGGKTEAGLVGHSSFIQPGRAMGKLRLAVVGEQSQLDYLSGN